jgi:hypothetical protein
MTKHPDVHTPWRTWSEEQILHVAVAYSNPVRWASRRVLLNDFRQHMRASANVVLHVGELAYGDRPFEVTGDDPNDNSNDVQLRTSHELWHKENILNLVVQRFPPGWRYGAVIDGDFPHDTARLGARSHPSTATLRSCSTLFQLLGFVVRASAVSRHA